MKFFDVIVKPPLNDGCEFGTSFLEALDVKVARFLPSQPVKKS